ncbi:hypothetical protein MKW94_002166, partial [Papaver nudicaule]|nr:hypothetical protein [Papaver nudicaule]
NELELYINDKNPPEAFDGFRRKLEALTSVTGNYFVNLVRALENGLSDVLSNQKQVTPSKEKEGSNRRRKGKKSSNRRR